jgi:toxin HigB-1
VAKRKLDALNAARLLEDLRVPPGNKLHALKDDREGQHAIHINDQYRVCFIWKEDGVHDVEVTDYH